jgi:CheY-like chemotaxis protein
MDKNVEYLKQMTLLCVEDDESIRNEIAHFLGPRVGQVLTATDGKEGLALFKAQRPDLVLSDIQMPFMDGLAMTQEIRKRGHTTPVIFITAFDDTQYLRRAITVEADGYVLKPVILDELMQTLLACADKLMQSREISTSRAQLAAYQKAAEEERQLVAELMSRMMRPEQLHDKQVRYWIQPTEVVSGDLVAVSRARNGRLYVMLADSTGHGLPAALNLLPINHIFYSMVSKGLTVGMIVEEMNWAVHEQSPVGRYVAAVVACIDSHNRTVEVWNGGIPSAYFLGNTGEVHSCFISTNLPLGVLDRTFTAQTEVYQWSDGGQLVAFSDGLPDAENADGEDFGEQRALQVLQQHAPSERHDALVLAVNEFVGNRHALDDMTLMTVDCQGAMRKIRLLNSPASDSVAVAKVPQFAVAELLETES